MKKKRRESNGRDARWPGGGDADVYVRAQDNKGDCNGQDVRCPRGSEWQ